MVEAALPVTPVPAPTPNGPPATDPEQAKQFSDAVEEAGKRQTETGQTSETAGPSGKDVQGGQTKEEVGELADLAEVAALVLAAFPIPLPAQMPLPVIEPTPAAPVAEAAVPLVPVTPNVSSASVAPDFPAVETQPGPVPLEPAAVDVETVAEPASEIPARQDPIPSLPRAATPLPMEMWKPAVEQPQPKAQAESAPTARAEVRVLSATTPAAPAQTPTTLATEPAATPEPGPTPVSTISEVGGLSRQPTQHDFADTRRDADPPPAPVPDLPTTPTSEPALVLQNASVTVQTQAAVEAKPTAPHGLTQAHAEAVVTRIVERIEQMRDAFPARTVTLRLDPPSLGTVEITVRARGDRVEATVSTQNEWVRSAVHDNRGQLAAQLQDRGLNLASFSVSGFGGSQAQTHQQQPQGRHEGKSPSNGGIPAMETTTEARSISIYSRHMDLEA